jgi:hypothetical protein
MPAIPAHSFDKSKTVVGRQSVIHIVNGAGVRQVERATAAGSITTSGNLTATITGAGITGSPVALSVAVLNGDTPAMWAQKVRLAIAANAAISALYDVDPALDATITLRRKVAAANDATLNIALADGTSDGATEAAESVAVTAGAADGPATTLQVDYLSDGGSMELGELMAPGADNGPAYSSRNWERSRSELYRFRSKEVKKIRELLGGLTGRVAGTVTLYVRDPDDAPDTVAMLSDAFPASVYRDPAEIAYSGDNTAEVTLIVKSHKDGPVAWTEDADVSA